MIWAEERPGSSATLGRMTVVARNKKARFDYEILETLEAGIILTGPEVKSCRSGGINLSGAYVSFFSGVPVLKGAKIAPYRFARASEVLTNRERLLLLKKSQIDRFHAAAAEKGVSIIPLEVVAGRTIKIVLGIARGRKTIDKRRHIRERETSRRLREGREI